MHMSRGGMVCSGMANRHGHGGHQKWTINFRTLMSHAKRFETLKPVFAEFNRIIVVMIRSGNLYSHNDRTDYLIPCAYAWGL